MAFEFGTKEWTSALFEAINDSSEYRNAAAHWGVGFNGNVLLAFEADEGLEQPVNLLVQLEAGACQGADFVDSADHSDAGFVLHGPFAVWKEILDRKSLAATAILTGKLKVRGDKMTLLKNTAANRALIHCTSSIDTDWGAAS
jgi:putative sterol carrier protein